MNCFKVTLPNLQAAVHVLNVNPVNKYIGLNKKREKITHCTRPKNLALQVIYI